MYGLELVEAHTQYVEAVKRYDDLTTKFTTEIEEKGNKQLDDRWWDRVEGSNVFDESLNGFPKQGEKPEPVKKALEQQSLEPLDEKDKKIRRNWYAPTSFLINRVRLEESSSN